MLEQLKLWMDPEIREGPEAMAVDEWLLAHSKTPVLRVYSWKGDWGSLGYFGKLAEAKASLPGVQWVRRWTGGGLVDHRSDWTYTLAIPAESAVARMKGAESYRWIHSALATALQAEGIAASLSDGGAETGAALCFHNPVNHDIVTPSGMKFAGAGQRRTRRGLLHQGSVAAFCMADASLLRAHNLAGTLCDDFAVEEISIPHPWLEEKVKLRYALPSWTLRR